ncbi:MAG: Cof-type HAD-IIB family hydrolase [Acidimicrobiales bacterium]|jgi:Cof subfamily protein (haloacid dehalogenase superfamily)
MSSSIRLVLSDIDGTLVPPDKILTERTIQAVNRLRDAGILFAITSSRPPRGLSMYIEPLKLETPISGFNGGMIVNPDNGILKEWTIDDDLVATTIGFLDEHDVAAWVYRGQEWYVRDPNGPYVHHEAEVCQFRPVPIEDFETVSDCVAKIVGASDDTDALTRARRDLQATIGGEVSATNSQSYYLDVTSPQATKGSVVEFLSSTFDIPTSEIATIGDGQNDISMFERSGFSIAMGNAAPDVKSSASTVTSSNQDEGFARAVERFILS